MTTYHSDEDESTAQPSNTPPARGGAAESLLSDDVHSFPVACTESSADASTIGETPQSPEDSAWNGSWFCYDGPLDPDDYIPSSAPAPSNPGHPENPQSTTSDIGDSARNGSAFCYNGPFEPDYCTTSSGLEPSISDHPDSSSASAPSAPTDVAQSDSGTSLPRAHPSHSKHDFSQGQSQSEDWNESQGDTAPTGQSSAYRHPSFSRPSIITATANSPRGSAALSSDSALDSAVSAPREALPTSQSSSRGAETGSSHPDTDFIESGAYGREGGFQDGRSPYASHLTPF